MSERGADVRGFMTQVVDFLFPPVCMICQTECELGQHALLLCESCQSTFPNPVEKSCSRCAAPLGPHLNDEKAGCSRCRGSSFAFDGVTAFGVYAEVLEEICQQAKHERGQPLIRALGHQLFEFHRKKLIQGKFDAIVPVPMHWRDRFARPVHPGEPLAAELSRNLRVPLWHCWLTQTRHLKKQSVLAPSTRREIVKHAYRSRCWRSLADKRILLVDDILTTGATASVCARALKNRGAKSVHVVVLARGIGR